MSSSPDRDAIVWARSPLRMIVSPQRMLDACAASEARGTVTDATRLERLFALHKAEQFEATLQYGLTRPAGEVPEWDRLVADALMVLGRGEEALARLDAGLARYEDDACRLMRASVLIRLNRPEATAAVEHVVERTGQVFTGALILRLLRDRGPQAVLDLLERTPQRFKAGDWGDARVRCLMELGRMDEALALMDSDRLVWRGFVEPPEGLDRDAFHRALVEDTKGMRSLRPNPMGKATRTGLQTECILEGNPKAVPLLLAALRRQVDRYVAERAGDDCPFIRRRPRRATMHSWVVMLARGGQQAPHIHPAAWLSGCYYVDTPEDADDELSGALNIPLHPAGGQAPWPVRSLRPEPGSLALFPGYFRHDTVPHQSDRQRVCFAFDVVPA